ncbi:MAG: PTS sugar transporter subunit IIA [Xanthobacteraceae bacterium]|nr:PTS sugar transporter subunit IIA [Xanthobacteraceae bacterium]
MKISDILDPADVLVDVRSPNKQQLLQTMAQKAAARLGLQADDIASALQKREELGSTGMGRGVAIPHARLPVVKKPFGMIARLKPPLDFDAIDAQPVDLAFVLLLPAPSESDQLAALALVARTLKAPETLVRLRQAKRASEIYNAIAE